MQDPITEKTPQLRISRLSLHFTWKNLELPGQILIWDLHRFISSLFMETHVLGLFTNTFAFPSSSALGKKNNAEQACTAVRFMTD